MPSDVVCDNSSNPGMKPLVFDGSLHRSGDDGILRKDCNCVIRTIRCTIYAHRSGVPAGPLGVEESADVGSKGSKGVSYDDANDGRHLETIFEGGHMFIK